MKVWQVFIHGFIWALMVDWGCHPFQPAATETGRRTFARTGAGLLLGQVGSALGRFLWRIWVSLVARDHHSFGQQLKGSSLFSGRKQQLAWPAAWRGHAGLDARQAGCPHFDVLLLRATGVGEERDHGFCLCHDVVGLTGVATPLTSGWWFILLYNLNQPLARAVGAGWLNA